MNFQSIIDYLNQIEPLLKTNQPFLMGIGVGLALLLTLMLIKSRRKQIQTALESTTIQAKDLLTNNEMEMLAGDDVISTQLDLARAYIEMGKSHIAKSILHQISKSGTKEQQQAAARLIKTL